MGWYGGQGRKAQKVGAGGRWGQEGTGRWGMGKAGGRVVGRRQGEDSKAGKGESHSNTTQAGRDWACLGTE